MNQVEIKSFLRTFIPFFIILELLTATIFYKEYQNEVKNLEQTIAYNMNICNYNTDDEKYACHNYKIEFFNNKETFNHDFLEKKHKKINTLYKEENLIYQFFSIPKTPTNYMKISYPTSLYQTKKTIFKRQRAITFFFSSLGILILTLGFSFYSLSPLRQAFKLTKEFVRDILHDFNTPISSLLLNAKTLPKTKESYDKIRRIEQSINTILSLQENLKSYLNHHTDKKEPVELLKSINNRVEPLKNLYPSLNFNIEGETLWIESNQASIDRILDNLLINAAKYNKIGGTVQITLKENQLILSDTGKGIKNSKKIFDRFYKEHERGLGIGLHIVKKLCDELNIKINVSSKVDKGTTFVLTFL